MLHADASPKPTPEGCTTNELRQQPPPVKRAAVRCLHELQSPSSPTKPRKLYRTESTYGAPIPSLNLGVAQFTAEHKQFDEVMQNMLDEKMVIDPNEQIQMTQGNCEDEPVAADKTVEPVAADKTVEPVAADAIKEELVTADKTVEPVAADKTVEPVAADNIKEEPVTDVAADNITEEPVTDVAADNATHSKDKPPMYPKAKQPMSPLDNDPKGNDPVDAEPPSEDHKD